MIRGRAASQQLAEAVRAAGRWPSGLYVHIPYCSSLCPYCDFNVHQVRSSHELAAMVEAILDEAACWASLVGPAAGGFRTVFVGGGTPGLLGPAHLRRLVEGLRARMPLDGVAEWSLEANPGNLNAARAQTLRQVGIHRVSLGVQSFDAGELRRLGRTHTPRQVYRSLRWLRAVGIDNVNLDLMFALPGQQPATWARTLREAVATGVPHISAYALTLEPGTPFYRRWRRGELVQPPEAAQARMYRMAVRVLEEAGLERYEVSNFSRPGRECLHHLNYWLGGEYLGLGPGAHSHWAGYRFANRRWPDAYRRAVGAGRQGATLPFVAWAEGLTVEQQMDEFVWLRLRLREGIDGEAFRTRFGLWPEEAYAPAVWELLERHGWLERAGRRWRLTPRGFLVADAVAARLLAARRVSTAPAPVPAAARAGSG